MLCTNSIISFSSDWFQVCVIYRKVPFDKSEFSKISPWVFIACLDDIKKAWFLFLSWPSLCSGRWSRRRRKRSQWKRKRKWYWTRTCSICHWYSYSHWRRSCKHHLRSIYFFIVFVPQAQLKRFCVIDQFSKLPKVIVDSKPNHFESKRAFNSCVEHAIRDFVVVNSKIMFLFSNRTGQNFYLPFLCC